MLIISEPIAKIETFSIQPSPYPCPMGRKTFSPGILSRRSVKMNDPSLEKVPSTNYRTERPRKDILEELRQRDDFPDFIFVAWGIVEMGVDDILLKIKGWSSYRPEAKEFLENLNNVENKLVLLRDIGHLSVTDFEVMRSFKDERNVLFCRGSLFIRDLDQAEKERIMDLGMCAVDVMHALYEKKYW